MLLGARPCTSIYGLLILFAYFDEENLWPYRLKCRGRHAKKAARDSPAPAGPADARGWPGEMTTELEALDALQRGEDSAAEELARLKETVFILIPS